MFPSLLRGSARVGRRPRWALVALCLVLAAVTAVDASRSHPARPRPVPTVTVVVATHALPAGARLTRADLTTVRWPAAVRLAGVVADARSLVGRRLVGGVAAREAITTTRLLGPGLTAGLGPDVVAIPVELAPDVGRLVLAGDSVDLLAVPQPGPTDGAATPGVVATARPAALVVGARLRVLAVFEPSADAAGGTDASAGGGTQLILAVGRPLALRIAALGASDVFTVVADDP